MAHYWTRWLHRGVQYCDRGYETPRVKKFVNVRYHMMIFLLTATHFRGSSHGHSSHEVRFD